MSIGSPFAKIVRRGDPSGTEAPIFPALPMPELVFKGKVHVANHHLVVPFHELFAVKSKGLAKAPSPHDTRSRLSAIPF